MSSGRRSDPNRTQDYRVPRGQDEVPSKKPTDAVGVAQATRRGVGHDERRPPPAVLPKRAKRVDQALGLVLASGDGLIRATLARGLVRAGCDVQIVQSESDVTALTEAPDVAVLDFDAENAPALFGALQESSPKLPVLALASDQEKVRRALQIVRMCPFEVVDRRASAADVLEAVKRLRG
jgi:hypothetical protein